MDNDHSDRRTNRFGSRMLVTMLALLVYFVAYYTWAEPSLLVPGTADGFAAPHFRIRQTTQLQWCDDGSIFPASREHAVQPTLRVFFTPAHWFDCRFRTAKWRSNIPPSR